MSLLLPAWETCSPLMEEPDLLVAGASAAWEARWALVTGGPWSGSGPARTAAAGTPIPGTCGQDLAHEGGPPARATGLGGDIGPLGAWGDELPSQVGQHHCGCVGAGDHHGLVLQGRDGLGGPGGVPPAPAGFEPGVSPCLARSLQLGWGGPSRRRASRTASCSSQGPTTVSRVGGAG